MTPKFWAKDSMGRRKLVDESAKPDPLITRLASKRTIRRLGYSRRHDVHWAAYGKFLETKVLPRYYRLKYSDYRREQMVNDQYIVDFIEHDAVQK